MSRAYLDHASTSPVRPEARVAMMEWLGAADPARVHTEGRMARAALEASREQVASLLGARPRSVVFTSSATEAINAAIWGASRAKPGAAIAFAAVEHSAVRDASERAAATVTLPVDKLGRIDVSALHALVDPDTTALVHCQLANHEVGTLQPVAGIVAWCRERDVLVHVDAASAAGRAPIAFDDLGADLLSVSAHKLGGPPGIGALLIRRGLRLDPLLVGGEQERARRAGFENLAAAAGFGAAAEVLSRSLMDEAIENAAQTEEILAAALAVDGVVTYGDTHDRVPHIVCLGIDGVEAEAVLLALDQAGVAAHSGSACSSESLEPSPVLEAMGVDADRSLRISVGWSTTDADVGAFARAFPNAVAHLRGLRGP